jgi:predicted nucleic acid-binding protein
VLIILTRLLEGKDILLWSWALSFENDKHPKADRREEIGLWEGRSEKVIPGSAAVAERAVQFGRVGIRALDAIHLASAEAGGADILLTCDDNLVKRAPRLNLSLRVLNPVAYVRRGED